MSFLKKFSVLKLLKSPQCGFYEGNFEESNKNGSTEPVQKTASEEKQEIFSMFIRTHERKKNGVFKR